MPGVAFHLAWCIIMILIVKDLWVAVEVEKHKAKKLAKERGVNVPVDTRRPSGLRKTVGALVWVTATLVAVLLWQQNSSHLRTPLLLVRLYATAVAISSAMTFGLFWSDKKQADPQEERVPEKKLHFWEMIGGWPGAMLAQESIPKWPQISAAMDSVSA